MSDNRPIGVFDSGVGGLSVLKELITLLPHESFLYYADSVHAPYGSKSPKIVRKLSQAVVDFLIKKDCKLVVVACNTATAHAIRYLRMHYNIPFIGMEPAVKPAAMYTQTGHIGVLATEGTLRGNHFKNTVRIYADNVNVHTQIGDGLVELVEKGMANTDEAENLLKMYLSPMLDNNIDKLVLGCTHYPFLESRIRKIIGTKIDIIDPALAVARHTKQILRQMNIESSDVLPRYLFYNTVSTNVLEIIASSFLKDPEIRFITN
jgi:glutamate racemase